jgi:hypothetical protein
MLGREENARLAFIDATGESRPCSTRYMARFEKSALVHVHRHSAVRERAAAVPSLLRNARRFIAGCKLAVLPSQDS